MARHRLNIETESRIRWKVYVRFGGEYLETGHDCMTRRRVLSLRYNDLTCPPTSVCAAFNVITAPKKFFVVPTTMHYTFTEQYDWSLAELARELAECSGAVAR